MRRTLRNPQKLADIIHRAFSLVHTYAHDTEWNGPPSEESYRVAVCLLAQFHYHSTQQRNRIGKEKISVNLDGILGWLNLHFDVELEPPSRKISRGFYTAFSNLGSVHRNQRFYLNLFVIRKIDSDFLV